MEVKNLFEPPVKKDIIDCINSLTSETKAPWGKMTVVLMQAHCQKPLDVAVGEHTLKGNLFFRLMRSLFKKQLYNDPTFKHGLSTDKSFIIVDQKDVEKEKQHLIQMIQSFYETNMSDEPHLSLGN